MYYVASSNIGWIPQFDMSGTPFRQTQRGPAMVVDKNNGFSGSMSFFGCVRSV